MSNSGNRSESEYEEGQNLQAANQLSFDLRVEGVAGYIEKRKMSKDNAYDTSGRDEILVSVESDVDIDIDDHEEKKDASVSDKSVNEEDIFEVSLDVCTGGVPVKSRNTADDSSGSTSQLDEVVRGDELELAQKEVEGCRLQDKCPSVESVIAIPHGEEVDQSCSDDKSKIGSDDNEGDSKSKVGDDEKEGNGKDDSIGGEEESREDHVGYAAEGIIHEEGVVHVQANAEEEEVVENNEEEVVENNEAEVVENIDEAEGDEVLHMDSEEDQVALGNQIVLITNPEYTLVCPICTEQFMGQESEESEEDDILQVVERERSSKYSPLKIGFMKSYPIFIVSRL